MAKNEPSGVKDLKEENEMGSRLDLDSMKGTKIYKIETCGWKTSFWVKAGRVATIKK